MLNVIQFNTKLGNTEWKTFNIYYKIILLTLNKIKDTIFDDVMVCQHDSTMLPWLNTIGFLFLKATLKSINTSCLNHLFLIISK